jgi:hypothetical protein
MVGFVAGTEALGAGVRNGVPVTTGRIEGVGGKVNPGLDDGEGLAAEMGAHVTSTFMAMKTAATPMPATAKRGTVSRARARRDLRRVNMARVCPTEPRSAEKWPSAGRVRLDGVGDYG